MKRVFTFLVILMIASSAFAAEIPSHVTKSGSINAIENAEFPVQLAVNAVTASNIGFLSKAYGEEGATAVTNCSLTVAGANGTFSNSDDLFVYFDVTYNKSTTPTITLNIVDPMSSNSSTDKVNWKVSVGEYVGSTGFKYTDTIYSNTNVTPEKKAETTPAKPARKSSFDLFPLPSDKLTNDILASASRSYKIKVETEDPYWDKVPAEYSAQLWITVSGVN